MPEQSFDEVLKDLKNKIYQPVYIFSGEETFFTDELCNYIEDHILNDMEKEFNQTVVYGLDSDVFDIISMARRFPMMANHQVLIVKEAQNLKESENLATYLQNPLKSTVLVIAFMHKPIDKRTKLYKMAKEKGCVFTSAKLNKNQLPLWIEKRLSAMGFKIDSRESFLLGEYLGSDLSKIDNELKKISLNVPAGSKITDLIIEDNVGISKDYNIFEFLDALIRRDIYKANRIVNYFAANPKENSIFMILPNLHNLFFKAMVYSQLKQYDDKVIASKLGVNPMFLGQYKTTSSQYRILKLAEIIREIKNYDLKAKGLGNINASHGELLRELTYKILHD